MEKSVPTGGASLRSRFERLDTDRFVFLDRARQCSELTLPTLIPPLGHNKTTKYYTPWQGVGARGVNNLASKLLLSLFPPNSPFFRLMVDEYTKEEMAQDPKKASLIDAGLAKIERTIQAEIEMTGVRAPLFLAIKHLIVGGNALIYLPADGGARVFDLASYVCQRDPKGNVLNVIIKEIIDTEIVETMFPKMGDIDAPTGESDDGKSDSGKQENNNLDTTEVYTRIYRDGKKWKMYQEVRGARVPGSEGSWPIDKPPFMALRWSQVEGEDYGRSYVEEYLGDLISLEGLSKALVEASAAAARLLILVAPNSATKASEVTEAENGAAITGLKDDVHCLQMDKQADMSIAQQAIGTITQRLSYAFLLASSIQRNGERVTAEEIRYMASELEDALGGVYTVLSQELQLPFVVRLMDRMEKAKRLPELPKGVVKPAIVTGLEALGRGHDLTKLQQFGQQVAQIGPDAMQYISVSELLSRIATSMNINTDGLIKSDDDVMQERQAAQKQAAATELAGKLGPAGIKAMSDQVIAAGGGGESAAPTPTGN
jgi:competence protein ComGC